MNAKHGMKYWQAVEAEALRMRQSNAELIAELLAAPEDFVAWSHDADVDSAVGQLAIQARAAIIRAKGQA